MFKASKAAVYADQLTRDFKDEGYEFKPEALELEGDASIKVTDANGNFMGYF